MALVPVDKKHSPWYNQYGRGGRRPLKRRLPAFPVSRKVRKPPLAAKGVSAGPEVSQLCRVWLRRRHNAALGALGGHFVGNVPCPDTPKACQACQTNYEVRIQAYAGWNPARVAWYSKSIEASPEAKAEEVECLHVSEKSGLTCRSAAIASRMRSSLSERLWTCLSTLVGRVSRSLGRWVNGR